MFTETLCHANWFSAADFKVEKGVEFRYEERQAQREEIARNQVVQQREVEDDPDDGKADGHAHADGEGGHHLAAGDFAVGDLFHLLWTAGSAMTTTKPMMKQTTVSSVLSKAASWMPIL